MVEIVLYRSLVFLYFFIGDTVEILHHIYGQP